MKTIRIKKAVLIGIMLCLCSSAVGCEQIVQEESSSELVIFTTSSEEVTDENSLTEADTEIAEEQEGFTEETEETSETEEYEISVEEIVDETFSDYEESGSYVEYHFRNNKLLNQHFEKHGEEFRDDFGYNNADEYEHGASDVINNPSALTKTEAEDGDFIYYIESTNEFVVLSTDGYIRTYFRPSKGIDYFNRQ